DGRGNRSLNPPPVAIPRLSSPQTISAWPAAAGSLHAGGGSALSTTRVEAPGVVQSAVPPIEVTSGAEEGHPTVWPGRVAPPFATGALRLFTGPKSPLEATTVTPFAAAASRPWRRFTSDCVPANEPSAAPRLIEMTSARWLVAT